MPRNQFLTQDDDHKILRKKLGACTYEIIGSSLSPFFQKKGSIGDHCHLVIKINLEGNIETHKFFVKVLPEDGENKIFAMETGAFLKEHQFYDRIIPEMERNGINILTDIVPRCYLTRLHDVAVFEDLEEECFIVLPQRICLSFECVRLVLQVLAKLHAAGFILEDRLSKQETGETVYRMFDDYSIEFQETLYSHTPMNIKYRDANIKGIATEIILFMNSPLKSEVEPFKKFTTEYIKNFYESVQPSSKYRNTICHGDLCVKNLMFKFKNGDPSECKLLEFQNYRYLPPAHDVICFLHLTTDKKFRLEHERTLTKFYYSELQKVLSQHELEIKNFVPAEEFERSCRDVKLFAVAQCCTYFNTIMLTRKQITKLFSDVAFSKKSFFEDRSEMIRKFCAEDSVYNQKLRDSILELREYFEKTRQKF